MSDVAILEWGFYAIAALYCVEQVILWLNRRLARRLDGQYTFDREKVLADELRLLVQLHRLRAKAIALEATARSQAPQEGH